MPLGRGVFEMGWHPGLPLDIYKLMDRAGVVDPDQAHLLFFN